MSMMARYSPGTVSPQFKVTPIMRHPMNCHFDGGHFVSSVSQLQSSPNQDVREYVKWMMYWIKVDPPLFMKHEEEIDMFLEQAKTESYKQVVNLGSRGLMCARDIVATAALRGQAQLAQQLQRSYSTGDVNRGEIAPVVRRVTAVRHTEIEEEEEDQLQVRTWTGAYDNQGRIIEQTVAEFAEEEVVVIEDPLLH
uniref:Uncharacterized protein n=1 Tax=Ditylenchus dipsaci TaxID=166011 RepID=A0A915D1K7_9BILA